MCENRWTGICCIDAWRALAQLDTSVCKRDGGRYVISHNAVPYNCIMCEQGEQIPYVRLEIGSGAFPCSPRIGVLAIVADGGVAWSG